MTKQQQADVQFRLAEELERNPDERYRAREAFLRCAALRRELYGDRAPEHCADIARLQMRAVRLWRDNRPFDATSKTVLLADCMVLFERAGSMQEVADCYAELGRLQVPNTTGDQDDAVTGMRYCTEATRRYTALGVETAHTVEAYLALGHCYRRLNMLAQRDTYLIALEVSRRVHGKEHWQTYMCASAYSLTFSPLHQEEPENLMWEAFPMKEEVCAAAKWHADALRPAAGDDQAQFTTADKADKFEQLLQRELMAHMSEPRMGLVVTTPGSEIPIDNSMFAAEIDEEHQKVRRRSCTHIRPGSVTVTYLGKPATEVTIIFLKA